MTALEIAQLAQVANSSDGARDSCSHGRSVEPTVSAQLARFVERTRFGDLPPHSVQMGKRCLLDALGVSLAASGLGEGCPAFVELAREQQGRPLCTLLGHGRRVPVEAAAFANGALAHSLDYGDEHDELLLHPNAQAVPAALAIAEAYGPVDGKELITALVVGCEIACRLASALRVPLSDYGWYPPPIFAAFGATAAAAKLLKLSAPQILDAMSLTLCQATCSGEIKYSPNSIIRGIRDAFGARAGVSSALLAQKGVIGFERPFEGSCGFFQLYARGQYDAKALIRGLGESYQIDSISFKPWPACRGTHAAIEAALDLRREHQIEPADVRRVRVRGPGMLQMLTEPAESKRRPATAIDAKFSVPFTVATALTKGRVSLADFLPQALREPMVLRLAGLVQCELDRDLPANDLSSAVQVVTNDGHMFERAVKAPRGSPAHPMSVTELTEKFTECLRWAHCPFDGPAARSICETVLRLEEMDDVRARLTTRMGHQG